MGDSHLWVFAGLLTAFCLLEGWASQAAAAARAQTARAAPLPYLAGLALLGVFWLSEVGAVPGGDNRVAQAGGLAITAGIALRILSILTLGRFFVSHVALVDRHRLVKSGIYAHLRHPSELGLLLIGFGAPVLLASGAGLRFAAALLLPLSLWRIHLEDSVMSATFGEQFQRYQATTPALLPLPGGG